MKDYKIRYLTGIKKSDEFARKKLATYAANPGLRCGHNCLYCSSPSLVRHHRAFQNIGRSAFEQGFSAIDPNIWKLVKRDAAKTKMSKRNIVMVSTIADSWAPEALKHKLGRKIVSSILEEDGWKVRVLTKNPGVEEDFDLFMAHPDRVMISLTTTTLNDGISRVIEPNVAVTTERLKTLQNAKKMGLNVYGMLCPVMPFSLVGDRESDFEELFKKVAALDPTEIYVEPINSRGKALPLTENFLRKDYPEEAETINWIRKRTNWDQYAMYLVKKTQEYAARYYDISRVRILLYRSSFSRQFDTARIWNQAGIIWL